MYLGSWKNHDPRRWIFFHNGRRKQNSRISGYLPSCELLSPAIFNFSHQKPSIILQLTSIPSPQLFNMLLSHFPFAISFLSVSFAATIRKRSAMSLYSYGGYTDGFKVFYGDGKFPWNLWLRLPLDWSLLGLAWIGTASSAPGWLSEVSEITCK